MLPARNRFYEGCWPGAEYHVYGCVGFQNRSIGRIRHFCGNDRDLRYWKAFYTYKTNRQCWLNSYATSAHKVRERSQSSVLCSSLQRHQEAAKLIVESSSQQIVPIPPT
jgi:hypothetical protein